MLATTSTPNDVFVALLPKLRTHAAICFRHVQCPQNRADKIAETVALAWKWLLRLHERGKDVRTFPMAFIFLVAKAVRNGRRLTGMEEAKDVLSERAQRRHGFRLEPLPDSTQASYESRYSHPRGQQRHDAFEERLTDNTVTPPPEAAAFRVDFPAWRSTLSDRDRRLIDLLMRDERAQDVARKFAVSPGRISQMRKAYRDDWLRFHGEDKFDGCAV